MEILTIVPARTNSSRYIYFMSSPKFEAFLAKIYVDESARLEFLQAPRQTALDFGLSETEILALEKIDRVGLELAVRSLERKRSHHHKK